MTLIVLKINSCHSTGNSGWFLILVSKESQLSRLNWFLFKNWTLLISDLLFLISCSKESHLSHIYKYIWLLISYFRFLISLSKESHLSRLNWLTPTQLRYTQAIFSEPKKEMVDKLGNMFWIWEFSASILLWLHWYFFEVAKHVFLH